MMQMPSNWIHEAIEIEGRSKEGEIETDGGHLSLGGTNAHRYHFELVTPDMNVHTEAPELYAFQDELGLNGIFTASLPIFSDPSGNASGSPTVKVAAQPGAKTLVLENAPANVNTFTVPGDFITFGGHSKAYMIASGRTYNTDALGELTLYLTKPLLKTVTAGEPVDFSPLFTLKPDKDKWSVDINSSSSVYAPLKMKVKEYY